MNLLLANDFVLQDKEFCAAVRGVVRANPEIFSGEDIEEVEVEKR